MPEYRGNEYVRCGASSEYSRIIITASGIRIRGKVPSTRSGILQYNIQDFSKDIPLQIKIRCLVKFAHDHVFFCNLLETDLEQANFSSSQVFLLEPYTRASLPT